MNLSDRIKSIIKENGLKQKEFAKSINVTESYISKLLRDESGLSKSTASLIERLYGYSADWILNGNEPKMKSGDREVELSPAHRKVIADIEGMDENDLVAVRAFIESFKKFKNNK